MIKYIKRFIGMIMILCLAVPGMTARAEKEAEVLRVGCVDIVNFLEIKSEDYAYGYGAEFLQEISKYTGWEYEYVKGSWKELMDKLALGEIDILLPAEYSPERAEIFLFSERQCCTDFAVLLTRNNNGELYYEDISSMQGKKVGMIAGNYLNACFEEYAADNGLDVKKVYFPGGTEMEAALQSGEVDIIVNGNFSNRTDQKLLAFIGTYPAYFIMNADGADKMELLNQAMRKIECTTPYYEAKLYEKYYGGDNPRSIGFTREELEYIENSGEITIAFADNRRPLEYYDEETGSYQGFFVNIISMLSEISGLTFVTAPPGEESSWIKLENGQADIMASATQTRGLKEKYNVEFTDDYYTDNFSLVSMGKQSLDISAEIKVAIPYSLAGVIEMADERYPAWQLEICENAETCMERLHRGEVDAALMQSMVLQAGDLPVQKDEYTVVLPNALQVQVCLALSGEESPLLMSILNKSIAKLDENRIQEYEIEARSNFRPGITLKSIVHTYPVQSVLLLSLFLSMMVFLLLQVRLNRLNRKWNEELRKASNAKSAFLAKMSHEMRTPLNGINGSLNILADTEGIQDNKYMQIAKSSVRHLTSVINDILDMSKIESGKIELREAFISYEELENRIYGAVLPLAEEKGITILRPVILSPHSGIYTDGMRLAQVALNLLSNAVKYTPENGSVTLNMDAEAVGEDKEKLRIEVLDNGIGMSKEMMQKMYDPFEQEENSGNILGSGLGLTITKELVTLMGGTIQIDSRLGEGTKAVVEITARWGDRETEPGTADSLAPAEGRLFEKRALLVEDNQINSEIARVQLQKFGLTVECAYDGRQAADCYLNSPEGYYDVIFMDIMMPVMNGYETTKTIRNAGRKDSADILIVAMTAMAFSEDEDRSFKSGMNYHLSKPFEPDELLKILKEAWPD